MNGPNREPFCNEIKPTTKWLGEVTPVVSIPFDHVAIPCRPLVTERIELFLLAHTIVDGSPIRLITKRMHENYKMKSLFANNGICYIVCSINFVKGSNPHGIVCKIYMYIYIASKGWVCA